MRIAINTDIIIFTVSIPYRYTAREELTFMKILFYGTKNYDEEFSRSFFLPIRELQLNLLKQIFTKKLLPLQKDMRQSALL